MGKSYGRRRVQKVGSLRGTGAQTLRGRAHRVIAGGWRGKPERTKSPIARIVGGWRGKP